MKKIPVYLSLLMAYGCQYVKPTQASISGCSGNPKTALIEKNVKPISLNSQPLKISGQASASTSIGYTFEAKTGQKLNYQTTDDICIWVYSPDNQLLKGKDLPQTGRYTVQISRPQGAKTFEINMSLEADTASSLINSSGAKNNTGTKSYQSNKITPLNPKPIRSSTLPSFSKADFPKSSCGDSKPINPSAYPMNFYPVNVPYNEDNLARVRSLFCADAYKKLSKDTRQLSIQIASFVSEERAIAFAELLKTEIPEASVGSPTVHYK